MLTLKTLKTFVNSFIEKCYSVYQKISLHSYSMPKSQVTLFQLKQPGKETFFLALKILSEMNMYCT